MEWNMTIIWLVILVGLILAELATMGLTTIWFAGGALIAAVLSAVGTPFWLQMVLFFVVSGLLMYFTRPVAVKYFNRDRARTNVESMIGKQAIVVTEINNLVGAGMVTVNGQEWTARSDNDAVNIAVGEVVVVKEVSGVKLIVAQRGE